MVVFFSPKVITQFSYVKLISYPDIKWKRWARQSSFRWVSLLSMQPFHRNCTSPPSPKKKSVSNSSRSVLFIFLHFFYCTERSFVAFLRSLKYAPVGFVRRERLPVQPWAMHLPFILSYTSRHVHDIWCRIHFWLLKTYRPTHITVKAHDGRYRTKKKKKKKIFIEDAK